MGKSLINLWIMEWTQYRPIDYFSHQSIPIPLLKLIYELFCGLWLVSFETSSLWDDKPRYFIKGSAELIGSFPSNQNTLYLLCLFYTDNEIITVCCRPKICTLIGWIESSRICLSFSKVSLGEFPFSPETRGVSACWTLLPVGVSYMTFLISFADR